MVAPTRLENGRSCWCQAIRGLVGSVGLMELLLVEAVIGARHREVCLGRRLGRTLLRHLRFLAFKVELLAGGVIGSALSRLLVSVPSSAQ